MLNPNHERTPEIGLGRLGGGAGMWKRGIFNDSCVLYSFIAQSVERTAVNREVVGSIPAGGVTLKHKDFDIRNVHATIIIVVTRYV
jgi:hypothetical protein